MNRCGWASYGCNEGPGRGVERLVARRLNDPYSAVRWVAYRSLRRLPDFADFDYDFVAPADERERAARRAVSIWESAPREGTADGRLLIDAEGKLDLETARFWVSRRDRRSIDLQE